MNKLKVSDQIVAVCMGRIRRIYTVVRVTDKYAFLKDEPFFSLDVNIGENGKITTIGAADKISDYYLLDDKWRKYIENDHMVDLIFKATDEIKFKAAESLQGANSSIDFKKVYNELFKILSTTWQQ